MTRSARRATAVFVAAIALSVAACGDNPHIAIALPDTGASLHGTIKYGTEDVHYALITVFSAGGVSYGNVDDEGRYHVTNVPLGEVKVAVNTSAARGDYQSAVMGAGAMTGSPDGKSGRKKVNLKFVDVPAKYFDPQQSGLTTTVAKGENTFDIIIPK